MTSRTLEQTLAHLEPHLPALGLIRCQDLTRFNGPDIYRVDTIRAPFQIPVVKVFVPGLIVDRRIFGVRRPTTKDKSTLSQTKDGRVPN